MEENHNLKSGKRNILERVLAFRELVLLIFIILLIVVVGLRSSYFLTANNFMVILLDASILMVVAIAQMMVILTAGIDLSVGNVLGFVGVITALSMTNGFGLFGGIIVGILAGTLCGLINGVLVGKGKLPPFIVTLGMMGIVRGIALIVSGGFPIIIIIIMILLFLIGYYILKNTTIGRKTYAIGSNEDASRLSGINVSRQLIFVYALSGFTASIAGLIETARLFSAYPTAGSGYELDSIAAVVIGGTSFFGGEGSILQTLIGALIMATLRNGCNLVGVSPFVQQALIGVIIIGAVYIDRIRSRTS